MMMTMRTKMKKMTRKTIHQKRMRMTRMMMIVEIPVTMMMTIA